MKILKFIIAISSLVANLAFASIVDNGLTGNVYSDSWGTLAGLSGTSPGPWGNSIPAQSSTGSGIADLSKISGGHYSATMGLYSWGGSSVLRISPNSNQLSTANNIVFNIRTNSPHDSTAFIAINSDGNTFSPTATLATYGDSFEGPMGTLTPTFTTYQWDLDALGVDLSSGINASYVQFTAANHLSITGLQLDQSDVYSVASTVVPIPAAAWLFGTAILGLIGTKLRKS